MLSRPITTSLSHCSLFANLQQVPEAKFFEAPPLGRHYSRIWAVEDLSEEWSESARLLNQEEGQWVGENGKKMSKNNSSLNELLYLGVVFFSTWILWLVCFNAVQTQAVLCLHISFSVFPLAYFGPSMLSNLYPSFYCIGHVFCGVHIL